MGMKGMWTEFKAFAFKGNLVDLAVAVVIGGAFGVVIKSLVDDIIMPTVSYAVTAAHSAGEVAKTAANKAAETAGVKSVTTAPATQTVEEKAKEDKAKEEAAAKAKAEADDAAKVMPYVTAAKAILKAEADAKAEAAKAEPTPAPTEAVKMDFTIGRLGVGKFLGSIINFIIIALAVFLVVVKGIGGAMARMNKVEPGQPTTKECPKCCSTIPIKASKCPGCTAEI